MCLQEIETNTSENVLEIDPNTTVTDLVTALNDSVTSTTLEETEKVEQRELTLKEREQARRQREKEKQRKDDEDHDGSRSSHHKHHKDKSEKHRSKHHSKKSKGKDSDRSRDRDSKKEGRSRSRSRRDSKSIDKDRSHRSSKDHSTSSSSSSKKISDTKSEAYDPYVPECVPLETKKDEIDVSDHEPSSTVIIKTPEIGLEESAWVDDTKAVWRGSVQMQDVARFNTALQTVSGDTSELHKDLTNVIDCVGRISTQMAWEYIGKIKKTKDIAVLRCLCSEENEEQKKAYMKLYSYLSTRNRLGVVQTSSSNIKDFYILPLDKDAPVPAVLTPLDCSNFNENR